MSHYAARTTNNDNNPQNPTLYRSRSLFDGRDNPRLYKALVDHFSALYPVTVNATMTEFGLGGGQTLRIFRSREELTFDVAYFDVSRFAAVARALNVRLKRYVHSPALQWNTERLMPVRSLLQLPRDPSESEDVQTVLSKIFHLSHEDEKKVERRVTDIIESLYLGARSPGALPNNEWQRSVSMLSDWLALQHIKQMLIVEDPDQAANMLISMMFGGIATNLSAGNALPDREKLISYLKSCISIFIRGMRPARGGEA